MAEYDWIIPAEPRGGHPALEEAGYTPLLSALLAARGVDTPEKARTYLSRGLDLISDPFGITDMDKAVSRVRQAIENKEKVTVYGDYDVDGITASCLMREYLRDKGVECDIYIPNRIGEGYGVNTEALGAMAREGTKLIVTVDCGITAIKEVEYARSLGMDVVITDHHKCPEELPDAGAIVDPQRDGGETACLSGVGVAFKLVCALEGETDRVLDRFADLVAMGTVADVMPLRGENRALVHRGLEKFNSDPRPGFSALIKEAGASEKTLNAMVLGYILAPRINAAGRLCRTEEALELLFSREVDEAERHAAKLCELNKRRQELETLVWRDAAQRLEEEPPDGPIVLASDSWHPGVVGIAASRLAEEFRTPAIMICMDGDMGKGSCRSWGGFNIFEGLAACSEYLDSYGGHACAAGLNIKKENIDAFRRAFSLYYQRRPAPVGWASEAELLLSDLSLLTMEGVESLDLLEPCGSENPRPVICVRDAVVENVTSIGGGKHLRLRLSKAGRALDGVFFSMTPETLAVRQGGAADVCFAPQINEFRGRRSVQLLVTALRPSVTGRECLSVLQGGEPSEGTSLDRQDMELVWRSLKRREQALKLSLPHIISREALGDVDPVRLCLCVRVLEELGLLSYSLSGSALSVRLNKGQDRRELDSSPLFRRLNRGESRR